MYRQIDCKLWTDPKVRELNSNGKLLFLYFLTHTHSHFSGIYYIPMTTICHETAIKRDGVEKGIRSLLDVSLTQYDPVNEIVWVCNMLTYNGVSKNILLGVANHLETLHNTPLIHDFLKHYESLAIPHRHPIETPSWGGDHTKHKIQDTIDKIQKKEKDSFDPAGPEVRLSNLLKELMLENTPDAIIKTNNWPKHIDLMIRLDKRKPEDIEKIIRWCQNDHGDGKWSGWAANIRSTATLRKQFDQLTIKMKAWNERGF